MAEEIVRKLVNGEWVTTVENQTGGGGSQTLADTLALGNDADALKIVNLADGVDPQDAATVSQVGGGSQPWNIVSVTGPAEVTAAAGDLMIVDAAADVVEVHPPTSPVAGDQVGVWLSTAPDQPVGVTTTDATEINGSPSVLLSDQYAQLVIVFDGTEWGILQGLVPSLATILDASSDAGGNAIENFSLLTPAAPPEIPATPDAQDIADALVALGLCTQAA